MGVQRIIIEYADGQMASIECGGSSDDELALDPNQRVEPTETAQCMCGVPVDKHPPREHGNEPRVCLEDGTPVPGDEAYCSAKCERKAKQGDNWVEYDKRSGRAGELAAQKVVIECAGKLEKALLEVQEKNAEIESLTKRLSSSEGGKGVCTDATLEGDGTPSNPLRVHTVPQDKPALRRTGRACLVDHGDKPCPGYPDRVPPIRESATERWQGMEQPRELTVAKPYTSEMDIVVAKDEQITNLVAESHENDERIERLQQSANRQLEVERGTFFAKLSSKDEEIAELAAELDATRQARDAAQDTFDTVLESKRAEIIELHAAREERDTLAKVLAKTEKDLEEAYSDN